MRALVPARMKVDSASVHKTTVCPLTPKALLSYSWEVGSEHGLCCFTLVQLCHRQVTVRATRHESVVWCDLAESLMFYRPPAISSVLVSSGVSPSVANGVKVSEEEEVGGNELVSVSFCCKARRGQCHAIHAVRKRGPMEGPYTVPLLKKQPSAHSLPNPPT